MDEMYKEKYLKYKKKYIELKNQSGGLGTEEIKVSTEEMYNYLNNTNEKNFIEYQPKIKLNDDNTTYIEKTFPKLATDLKSIQCSKHHQDMKNYIVSEESLIKLSNSDDFKRTVLNYYYKSSEKPGIVDLLLNTKLVPAKMGNMLSKDIRKKLSDFVDVEYKDIDDIIKILFEIISFKKNTSGNQTIIGNITKTLKNFKCDIANAGIECILPKVKDVLIKIKNLINPNVINAIKYLFLTDKYKTDNTIWDYLSALLEFVLCIFNCVSEKLTSSLNQLIYEIKSYTIDILTSLTNDLSNYQKTLNSYMNSENIKKAIKTYTNDLPVSFLLLDKIINLKGEEGYTCKNFFAIYHDIGLGFLSTKEVNVLSNDIIETISSKKLLKDFLIPFSIKNKNYLYIPPSVLLFLSMKMNPEGMKKKDNIYLTPIPKPESIPITNINPYSYNESLYLFTSWLYDSCKKEEQKLPQEKALKKNLKINLRLICKLFGFNKKLTNNEEMDNISIESGESGESIESIESGESIESINSEDQKIEDSQIDIINDKDDKSFKKKVTDYINKYGTKKVLELLKTGVKEIHEKLCDKKDLTFEDFDGIIKIFYSDSVLTGVINKAQWIKRKAVTNLLILTLSTYTAFLPFDITEYNILNRTDPNIYRYIQRYKFYEIYLQEKFEKKDSDNFNVAFLVPEKVSKEIQPSWYQLKKKLKK